MDIKAEIHIKILVFTIRTNNIIKVKEMITTKTIDMETLDHLIHQMANTAMVRIQAHRILSIKLYSFK